MSTAWTRVIGPDVRKRTLYNIKVRRVGGKRKKKKRSESDEKDEVIKIVFGVVLLLSRSI